MAEIFISYKSERRKAAERLEILRCYGYSVWFDYSLLRARILASNRPKIREAKAAIVLW